MRDRLSPENYSCGEKESRLISSIGEAPLKKDRSAHKREEEMRKKLLTIITYIHSAPTGWKMWLKKHVCGPCARPQTNSEVCVERLIGLCALRWDMRQSTRSASCMMCPSHAVAYIWRDRAMPKWAPERACVLPPSRYRKQFRNALQSLWMLPAFGTHEGAFLKRFPDTRAREIYEALMIASVAKIAWASLRWPWTERNLGT